MYTAATFLIAEVSRCGAANIEATVQVNVHNLMPIVLGHFVEDHIAQVTGIVNNGANLAKAIDGLSNHFIGTFPIGNAVGVSNRINAKGFNFCNHFFSDVAVEIINDHVTARFGNFQGDGATNTTARAGDNNRFTFKMFSNAHCFSLLLIN